MVFWQNTFPVATFVTDPVCTSHDQDGGHQENNDPCYLRTTTPTIPIWKTFSGHTADGTAPCVEAHEMNLKQGSTVLEGKKIMSDDNGITGAELSISGGTVATAYDFPCKLHKMLTDSEADGNAHIFSWLPHGKSFRIHKRREFVSEILPKYYQRVNVRSFLRQLNLYRFKRETNKASDEFNAYSHRCCIRGRPELLSGITRTPTNRATTNNALVAAKTRFHSGRQGTRDEYTTVEEDKTRSTDSIYAQRAQNGSLKPSSSTCTLDCIDSRYHASLHEEAVEAVPGGSFHVYSPSSCSGTSTTTPPATTILDTLGQYYMRYHQGHQQHQVKTEGSGEIERFRAILTLFLPAEEANALSQKAPDDVLESRAKERVHQILQDLEPKSCF